MSFVDLGGIKVGPDYPPRVIAEAGVNHNGKLSMAKDLVDAADNAGADFVKFQTYQAENVIAPSAPMAPYQKDNVDNPESQLEMAKELEFTSEQFRELQDYAEKRGIPFLSSPFDCPSVDFLTNLDIPAIKIPSGEINNYLLLDKIAKKNEPMILSTGMSNTKEIDEAIRRLTSIGNEKLILLHCVSQYPADPEEVNLLAIDLLQEKYQYPIGFSDHTLGVDIALAAVARGSKLIEKHLTLNKNLPGPDHEASLEPDQLKKMVESIKIVHKSLGDKKKKPVESEKKMKQIARRSLALKHSLDPGDKITEQALKALRPAEGIPPNKIDDVIGERINTRKEKNEIIFRDDIN